MNAIQTQCPCCLVEQGISAGIDADARVCERHYARENAAWQKHLASRKLVQQQYEGTPSFLERYQDNVENYWEA
jgi:hypothetical protein